MLSNDYLRRMLLVLVFIGLLSGCSGYTGSKELKGQIYVLNEQLHAEDWEALSVQIDRLTKLYSKNEWKLQLIGDEGEYEKLHESINRLKAAIEMKDAQAAKLELATIQSIVEDIYSL